jgi:ABC-type amino acid transport substrate-binding protein
LSLGHYEPGDNEIREAYMLGKSLGVWLILLTVLCGFLTAAVASDLREVKERGVLRHLGVPKARFVTGSGDGFDVELTRLFARYLGVRYEYVKADWETVVQDLIGKKIKVHGTNVEIIGDAPVRGDMIANGLTVLPWRQKVVSFSQPTFLSQILLLARADSKAKPIRPSKDVHKDIEMTRALMKGRSVLALEKTCLDPGLYNLSTTGANVIRFSGQMNELAPAVLNNDAEMTLLDVPDSLLSMEKWPGKLKIIGPVSEKQLMCAGFSKDAPQLLAAYNEFLKKAKKDGVYMALIRKYYPSAKAFFPDFLREK